jgi:hypothetical protein
LGRLGDGPHERFGRGSQGSIAVRNHQLAGERRIDARPLRSQSTGDYRQGRRNKGSSGPGQDEGENGFTLSGDHPELWCGADLGQGNIEMSSTRSPRGGDDQGKVGELLH